MGTVDVVIIGGPSVSVPWFQNMNAQQALEGAYNVINNGGVFTYALQYYGAGLGYLVVMVNETYDSFISSSAPYYYWQFLLNGVPASSGIDATILNAGDTITFGLELYVAQQHQSTTVGTKHAFQLAAARSSVA